MTVSPNIRIDFAWRRANMAAIASLCAAALAAIVISAASRPLWIGREFPIDSGRIQTATDWINPNTASAASMDRLPGVGPVRAGAIVDYRQKHPPEPFRTAGDLEKVPGIGPGTVREIGPYLIFP